MHMKGRGGKKNEGGRILQIRILNKKGSRGGFMMEEREGINEQNKIHTYHTLSLE